MSVSRSCGPSPDARAFTSAATLLGVAQLGYPGQLVEVDVTAVTDTAVDVTVVPLESTTRAVMLCAPAEVGTHVSEYGKTASTPINVVPA